MISAVLHDADGAYYFSIEGGGRYPARLSAASVSGERGGLCPQRSDSQSSSST